MTTSLAIGGKFSTNEADALLEAIKSDGFLTSLGAPGEALDAYLEYHRIVVWSDSEQAVEDLFEFCVDIGKPCVLRYDATEDSTEGFDSYTPELGRSFFVPTVGGEPYLQAFYVRDVVANLEAGYAKVALRIIEDHFVDVPEIPEFEIEEETSIESKD